MAAQARFESFRLDPVREEVVYAGIMESGERVEVRQAVGDLDVMLMLVAHVLERGMTADRRSEQSHETQAVTVEPAQAGGLVLSLQSHGVTRSFRLPPHLAGQASEQLSGALRRARLRLVSDPS